MNAAGFTFDFRPGRIVTGAGCVDQLGTELERQDLDSAMLVSGRTVGTTPAVVDPIRKGLGDRLVAEFPETTPAKTLGTALAGLERARTEGVDAVVAVGGGSTLDTAKVLAALSSHGDSAAAVARDAVETGDLPVATDGDPLPIVAVPTTLAGADLSDLAGVTLTLDRDADLDGEQADDGPPSGGVRDPRLMPDALFYDADLYRTTPQSVLAASAMNGFDKGLEMLYSPLSTPITDGTAARGLRLLRSGLGTIREDPMDADRLSDALAGIVAVQYGLAGAEGYRASIVHAFGHGFSHGYDVHQGTIHGIVAPHVLRYVFSEVDGRRDLIAEALGLDVAGRPADVVAEAIVDAVAAVRDELGLPGRLRDVEGVAQGDFPEIADAIHADDLLGVAPDGVDPSVAEIAAILERAW
ncbi:iron-containing alcohol dehydrogenase family protein [Halobellus sp. H-GB7]|uniref:iron-containing alcohol dehydrogenase family protein n=1 Tax=Halobellus sp. H-GB7 TaxID=3069756 RepID=UPI0027B34EC1|nr:iron-containing alcohol dehydrogenase family protein [Halobellus sp. H-GB7]MDQ2054377.1 iron-containing alcohol dehydrogenase family protein [Halobellus sp. H-GB7]